MQLLYRSSRDSPLEGNGFELPVPRHNELCVAAPLRGVGRRSGAEIRLDLFCVENHSMVQGASFGWDGLWFASLLGRSRELAVIFEDPLARERALEPIEELGGRIDLVVVSSPSACQDPLVSWRWLASGPPCPTSLPPANTAPAPRHENSSAFALGQ
jgi:hypothetical protein